MKERITISLLIAFVAATSFQCSKSPDHESPIIDGIEKPVELDGNLQSVSEAEVNTPAEDTAIFDEAGLSRLKNYLDYSESAHNGGIFLGLVGELLNIYYDWKEDPEKYPHLKGGKSDPIGKLLTIIALNRFPHEVRKGLLEMIHNQKLFKELIDTFTSETFISKEDLTQFKKAIESNNLESIELEVDNMYISFIKHFGQYYHIHSEWVLDEENSKLIPRRMGYDQKQTVTLKGIVQKKIIMLSESHMKEETKEEKSPYRIELVKFITRLIQKYYDIPMAQQKEATESETKP